MLDRARAEARALGVPPTVVSEPNPALRELYEAPYVLIRPEQPRALLGTSPPGRATLPDFKMMPPAAANRVLRSWVASQPEHAFAVTSPNTVNA
jgi:hypothetical protein